ncbi:MAG: hypothetical protein J5916_08780 [Oscillospiraceae bacterium]|nr:hypothetical protein [Oscillospiraceae bacterium]MBO6159624.1 hypothetical protein [Bacillota bacterium]
MARRPKYENPQAVIENFYSAVSDSYHRPGCGDEVGDVPGRKKQELLAEEFGISRIKVRKILITTGDLHYPLTAQIEKLLSTGLKVDAVAEKLKISRSTLNSLLPYSKGVYKLSEVSAAAERTALYRERKATIASLHTAMNDGSTKEQKLAIWRCVCLFAGYPFQTSGRSTRDGIKFTYTVSRSAGAGGRHYNGESVDGYGNELWIIKDGQKAEKSISRSTVDLALKNALEEQEREGFVSGPRKLGVPGARSNLYAMFLRFGVIKGRE